MEIRRAVAGDALAVARVHVRAWQAGYRGLVPDDYLDGLRAEDRAARYTFDRDDGPRTTVAVVDGVIRGFATTSGDELAAFHVDPEWWRRGIGRALIERARGEIAARGVRRARLWLLVGNTRGQRFYERDGWTSEGTRREETIWGVTVEEIAFVRSVAYVAPA